MSWLANIVPPKIKSWVNKNTDIPDNLWHKCTACEQMLFHRDLQNNAWVCSHCQFHFPISLKQRFELLFDGGDYQSMPLPDGAYDPLQFKDVKRYKDRLKQYQSKTGENDAIMVVCGNIQKQPFVVAGLNFDFMGGSMGTAVGEGIIAAANLAIEKKKPLLVIPSSGGARMQEGIFSLMQMPRTTIAIEDLKRAGLPFIVFLVHPTMGGVSASFAMLGDLHIAETGAVIGFAGRRVIEQTVREVLPDDFQTAQYLKEHGMVDMVIARHDMSKTIGTIASMLMHKS